MREKQRAQFIQQTLDQYFPNPPISLAYRCAYTLLIAVVLSARCTDQRVNEVTPKLFAHATTPRAMAALPAQMIESIIRPCGLAPAKSKAIQKLSEIIVEKYGGEVPRDMQELEKLPGVGHKTASVMMILAFHEPAFPVDTHIHRCAKRWGLSSGKNVAQTERDLKRLFPQAVWGKLHLQIIYFGRQYCPARGHDISKCPICSAL